MQLYTDRPNLARESREMLPGTLDMPSRVDVSPCVAAFVPDQCDCVCERERCYRAWPSRVDVGSRCCCVDEAGQGCMGIICAQAGSRLAAVLNRVRQACVWRFLPPAPPTLHCNSPVAAGGEGP